MSKLRQDLERALGKKPAPVTDDPPKPAWTPTIYSDEERKTLVRGGDAPIALLPLRGREPWPWPTAVRTGVLCLEHGDWEYLAWDGLRLGPRCCLDPNLGAP